MSWKCRLNKPSRFLAKLRFSSLTNLDFVDASPEKASVGSSVPSLPTIQPIQQKEPIRWAKTSQIRSIDQTYNTLHQLTFSALKHPAIATFHARYVRSWLRHPLENAGVVFGDLYRPDQRGHLHAVAEEHDFRTS
jgi:hypothetical protein